MSERGVLFLVVGPSGAGKDTLIEGARRRLGAEPGFYFQRRVITRPADAGGEDHEAATMAEFEAIEARGGFMLAWRAHKLAYGVPIHAEKALAGGVHVIVNVSRTVIDEARRRFQPIRVLSIAADPDQLRRRLFERGRESADVIEDRVMRAAAYAVEGPDVVAICNTGSVLEGVDTFVAALRDGAAAHSACG